MIRAYNIFEPHNSMDWMVYVEGWWGGERTNMEMSDISEMATWCLRELGYSRVYARSPNTWGQVIFDSKEDAFLFYLTFKK